MVTVNVEIEVITEDKYLVKALGQSWVIVATTPAQLAAKAKEYIKTATRIIPRKGTYDTVTEAFTPTEY